MARRRFQSPTPCKEGQFWWLRVWDANATGSRKRKRIKLANAEMAVREVQKIVDEMLRPMNQGLALTGSAMRFSDFMSEVYFPTYLPLLSSRTQASYRAMTSHLKEFGRTPLRDLTRPALQQYFSGMAGKVPYPTISKVRDVLSSVLRSAVDVEYLNKNPMRESGSRSTSDPGDRNQPSRRSSSIIWCKSFPNPTRR